MADTRCFHDCFPTASTQTLHCLLCLQPPQHFLQTQRDHAGDVLHSTGAVWHYICPAPPSYILVVNFSQNMGEEQNSNILLLNGCMSVRAPRYWGWEERFTACKSWFSWYERLSWSSYLSQNHMGTTFLILCFIYIHISISKMVYKGGSNI